MRLSRILLPVLAALAAPAAPLCAQTAADLFDANAVQEIRLTVNTRDLAALRAHTDLNTHYVADLAWKNVKVRNVAIRSRGQGSRNPIKPGFRVDMARYTTGQTFVGLSAITTLTRRPIGPVRSDPDTRALLLEVMREAVAVGRAKGVAMDPDFAEKRLAFVDTLPAQMTSSMHNDLDRGNRLEVGWLSGAVVRLGRETGVATPANRAVYAGLKLQAGPDPGPAGRIAGS